MEYAAGVVNPCVDAAREAHVPHLVVLTGMTCGVPPDHKYACSGGSYYAIVQKVGPSVKNRPTGLTCLAVKSPDKHLEHCQVSKHCILIKFLPGALSLIKNKSTQQI